MVREAGGWVGGLRKSYQLGVYVPLKALFLVLDSADLSMKKSFITSGPALWR